MVAIQGRTALSLNGTTDAIGAWYDQVRAFPLDADAGGVLMRASGVRLYRERYRCWRRLAGSLAAGHYDRRLAGTVRLTLRDDALVFTGPRGAKTISFHRLTGVTIESNTVIVGVARRPAYFFRFAGGVGKCWEDALRSALDAYHAPARIKAYYPRLLFAEDNARQNRCARVRPVADFPATERDGSARPLLFTLLGPVVRGLIYPRLPVTVHGRHHVPATGPAVILPNHGSFLDAILLGAALDRPIGFMTKNSEFRDPAMAFLLRRLYAFPVRRYAVDAQAVRNARRIVAGGRLLGLFPEGERSWDGRMLPLRRGALRLLLTFGVPIVPVGIAGAYPVMPRWTHRPRPHPVTIRFGVPIHLPPLAPGRHTPVVIAALDHLLRRRIADLL